MSFIKSNSKLIVMLMLVILLFGIGSSFASSDVDDDVGVAKDGDLVSVSIYKETLNNAKTETISISETQNNNLSSLSDTTLQSSKDSDSLLSEGESTGTFSELNTLIKGTEKGGTLILSKNYTYDSTEDISYSDSGITISKSIIIDGAGYTIDGNNLVRGFIVNANDVVLKNVNIINCKASSYAGAVYWLGDEGQLINVNISNARITTNSYACSGGISWWGNDGLIDNLDITNSRATFTSGDGRYGQILSCAGLNLKICNSKIHDVSVENIGYGLIAVLGSSANVLFYKCNFTEVYKLGTYGLFFYEATAGLTFDRCNVINTKSNAGYIFMNRQSTTFYNNCYFQLANSILCVDTHYSSFKNCTFKSLSRLSAGNSMMDTYFDGCTFINCGHTYHPMSGSIDTFINSKFINCTNIDFSPVTTGGGYVIVDNCTFDNSTTTHDSVIYVANGFKNIITNNKFINTQTTFDIVINSGVTSLVKDNIKSTGASATVQNNGNNLNYYDKLYVTATGNGIGTQSNPCNITFAFNNIAKDGTVYISDGTYDLNGQAINVNFHIVNSKNVVFTNGSTFTLKKGYSIKDLTFKNFKNYIYLGFDSTIANCIIKDSKVEPLYLSYTSKVYNSTILNVSTTGNIFQHYAHGINSLTIDGLTISESNFLSFTFVYWGNSNALFENINISNSNFTSLLSHSATGVYRDCNNIRFVDMNVANCKITDTFIQSNPSWARSISFENINVKDSLYTSTNPFINLYDNCKLINLSVVGLTKTNDFNLIKVNRNGCEISGVTLSDYNTALDLITSTSSYKLSKVTLNNVNANSAFTGFDDSTFSNLDFTKTYFTKGISTLGNNVELTSSSFNDFKGNVKINGNGIKITDSTFTKGKVNNANDNGSCIEIINGNQTYIQHCTFKDNSAYCGGAIYINNVTNSSYIMYCDFSGNTATLHGGAIYIETGIYYFISDDTLAKLSKTDPNNNLYKEIGVKETMSVVWVAVGGTGDGSFANPCAFEDSLDRVSPYGSIMFKGIGAEYNYPVLITRECLKPGIKFMGNNSSLSNFALLINELAIETEISNLIFSNVADTSAIIWEGADGKIVNCEFKNNGGDKVMYGAALKVLADNLAISNSIFKNNIAGNDSISYGGAIYCNASGLTLDKCDFSDNTVYGYGSHIYLDENANNVKIYNGCKFNNGKTSVNSNAGSAIYILSDANVMITDSSFTNNKAINGGALNFNRLISTVNIIRNNFTRNTASNNGGAIAFTGNSINALVMSENTFDSNTASNFGGAIYSNVAINVNNSKFINNNAKTGGAIYLNAAGSVISDSTFTDNSASNYRNIYSSVSVAPTLSGNTFNGASYTLNSISNGNYPVDVVVKGTFDVGNNFATDIPVLANNNEVTSFTTSNSNSFSADWKNVLPNTYRVSVANMDNNGNKFVFTTTPSVSFSVTRRNVIYVGNGATGKGTSASDPIDWDSVADILSSDGTIYFTSGTYTNFYDKVINNSWTLKPVDGAKVVLDANNKGRIFSITANNVAIDGFTFQNGKVTTGSGGAIYNTGTGVTIKNSIFTGNTAPSANIIGSTKPITITNSQLKNPFTITTSNINWGSNEVITITFPTGTAPSTGTILLNGADKGTYTVSSNQLQATISGLTVGSYVVTYLKGGWISV